MTAHIWTVAEAKSKLSELLRRARAEGPQRIGARDRFVVVSGEEWDRMRASKKPLGRFLLEDMPRVDLPPIDRRDPPRAVPFADEVE
jgi:prevent-host-death family protein